MSSINDLSPKQLRQAAQIKEKIADLEQELANIFGNKSSAPTVIKAEKPARKKHQMSAAGRARIIAAQKARWAKIKAGKK